MPLILLIMSVTCSTSAIDADCRRQHYVMSRLTIRSSLVPRKFLVFWRTYDLFSDIRPILVVPLYTHDGTSDHGEKVFPELV